MNSSHSRSVRSLKSFNNSNVGFTHLASPRNQLNRFFENNVAGCIFEIYGIGFSYFNSRFGNPSGVGFMITENIAMTSNSVINDEEIAGHCFAVFPSGQKIKFDPNSFFYTNRGLNFTVISLKHQTSDYIDISQSFKLRDGSQVFYPGGGLTICQIIGIDSELFTYTTGKEIMSGTPIFRLKRKTQKPALQGLHHKTNAAYSFSLGTRIDAIIQILCSVVLIPSETSDFRSSLSRILQKYSNQHKFELKKKQDHFGEGRVLFWVEWGTKNMWKYDVGDEKWTRVKFGNFQQFITQETEQWRFNYGSRLVYLPDESFLVVGGTHPDSGGARGDVYQFLPARSELYRKKSMLERRDGPAVLYRQGYVYVVGGRFTYTTCEKYNLQTNTWSSFSSMIHGRYEPVACLLQGDNFMYVAGGQPEESVGKTIERYSFSQDRWEALSVVFTFPVLRCGIFPVTQTKFALLGGRHSKAVLIFEAVQEIIEGRTEEIFRVFEIEDLSENIESVYPVVYNIGENKVFFTKSPEGQAPSVLSYTFRSFLKQPDETVSVFRKNFKLPQLSGRSGFFSLRGKVNF